MNQSEVEVLKRIARLEAEVFPDGVPEEETESTGPTPAAHQPGDESRQRQQKRETDEDLAAQFLDRTVEEIEQSFKEQANVFSPKYLQTLREVEQEGQDRKGVIKAIDAELKNTPAGE